MAHVFTMPQLGSTMEEGTIVRWHKSIGDVVREGETLLEIETDKATMEVEAPTAGVLRRILAGSDAVIAIHEPIAIIGGADESIDAIPGGETAVTAAAVESDLLARDLPSSQVRSDSGRTGVVASPRARRKADELGVAISALSGRGSGPGGRIVERDVLNYRPDRPAETAHRTTPLAARIASDLGVDIGDLAVGLPGSRVRRSDVMRHVEERVTPAAAALCTSYKSISLSGMRKRIADNVAKSAFTAPHVTLTLEVDMTACSEFRAKAIAEIERTHSVRLSFTDILVKAADIALRDHPMLNASLEGDEIRIHAERNIGVAVALDEGLIVPVVRSPGTKSLGAISVEMKALVERARTGRFLPDDLAGGTFTITNLGAFGIDVFDPIIVTGQAAILGVGRIAQKPVVVDGQIAVRSMMNLCLSFDHRILDGAPAARFLQRLQQLLENPLLVLL